ncbi:zona pellucida sperm-binding 3-like [Pelobates cultripes]|uniref:Zona pellucida sperm-binding 3-like n=1 Tax=Pelobates cultripes TaxID=61616 RepID=A0AAD1RHH3_PELCU|nr:zona pellucida sperm-binding 3-like [Pelobates cultripes]
MMIFVDRCVATLSPDATSSPRYEIIAQNGCLLDGKQEDSSSAFRSPKPTPDRLQFTIDAFRFVGSDNSMIYITCNLRAVAESQVPDPMNKACSFSKSTNLWTALEGNSAICSCCETGNCATTGSSRIFNPRYPGQRGVGKREAPSGPLSDQEHKWATLGPLLVIGAEQSQALAVTQESTNVELWVLVTLGILSVAVIVVGALVAFIMK